MELKTARLTLLIDPAKKAAFEQLCARQDRTPSQVVRQLIREYLTAHGATFQPSGLVADSATDGAMSKVTDRPAKAPGGDRRAARKTHASAARGKAR